MTVIFRVILVIVSILTMAFMMRKIRQAKVQIEAALFWVIMALILVVFSLFPGVADACAICWESTPRLISSSCS